MKTEGQRMSMEVPHYIVHVRKNKDGIFVEHLLEAHLKDVAELAGGFAAAFGNSDWAALAGLWHDLGKYSKAFQKRIRSVSGYDHEAHLEGNPGRVDHSTAGALYAIAQIGMEGRILAYLIAGHHTGLPDWDTGETSGVALKARLDDKSHLERAISQTIPQAILNQPKPVSLLLGKSDGFALWVRMLFSCLIDADRLDTEAFMDEGKALLRVGGSLVSNLC